MFLSCCSIFKVLCFCVTRSDSFVIIANYLQLVNTFFKKISNFFKKLLSRITKPFFGLLSSENAGLASKHCKHQDKKCDEKEHASISLDLFFNMFLSGCFLFFGKGFFSLCHGNVLLLNIVLIIYYISLKKASIVFNTYIIMY